MSSHYHDQRFFEAFRFLEDYLKGEKYIKDIIVKGSLNSSQPKLPHWSDLDITIVVEKTSIKLYDFLSEVYSLFKKNYPEIKLSLTPINEEDNLQANCLHHHGIKPIAFNYELKTQNKNPLYSSMSLPNKDAVRLSSTYRYYEILYDFRKTVIQNNISLVEFVNKYFHRASRFIRTHFEIINPNLLRDESMIDESLFIKEYDYEQVVGNFFELNKYVRDNWMNIIEDEDKLRHYKDYIIMLIEKLNDHFIPIMVMISKEYMDDSNY